MSEIACERHARLTFLACTRNVVMNRIHRAHATIAISAVRTLGVLMGEPGTESRLEVVSAGIEAQGNLEVLGLDRPLEVLNKASGGAFFQRVRRY